MQRPKYLDYGLGFGELGLSGNTMQRLWRIKRKENGHRIEGLGVRGLNR